MRETPEDKITKVDSKHSLHTATSRTPHHTHYKKYNKITEAVRTTFLQFIINENYSIKKAAEELNINYSSAKSIIADFRKESQRSFKRKQPVGARVCEWVGVDPHTLGKITLFGSIGNNITSQKDLYSQTIPYTPIPFYQFLSQTFEYYE